MTTRAHRFAIAIAERIPVRCACCDLPIGYVVVEGGRLTLEITSRHNGERHVTRLPVGEITDTVDKRLAG